MSIAPDVFKRSMPKYKKRAKKKKRKATKKNK